jgi:hypothetical protein
MLWLRRTADEGFPCYPLFERDPGLANLRGRPEFAAFMQDMRARSEKYRRGLTS